MQNYGLLYSEKIISGINKNLYNCNKKQIMKKTINGR